MTVVTEKLLIYALGRGVEYYDAPAVREIVRDRGRQRLPFLVDHLRHRQQHSISNEEIAVMIIKKMAIPRRAVLRGLGAGLALPLLDAMVPALSVVARATTTPTRRLGFVYMPNGANMVTWTPPTTGADFTLSPTLTPLAPFQNQMVVATGLSNKEADSQGDGSGEHPRGVSRMADRCARQAHGRR